MLIIFTFQYGATKTEDIKNGTGMVTEFTFQYGATKTMCRFIQTVSNYLFTFQYGATKTIIITVLAVKGRNLHSNMELLKLLALIQYLT